MASRTIQRAASRILLRHENYVFKILHPTHTKDALNILTTSFQHDEPLTNTYYRSFPLQHHKRVQKWRNFWTIFAEDFTTNGVSVGCFDVEKNDELVGVSVAKDLHFVPEGFEDQFMQELNFISPVIKIEEHLLGLADEKIQPILDQRGTVMDIWGVAIKKSHFGKRILGNMMKTNMLLGKEAGYTHAFCYATNFKTALSLNRLKFHKIAELNVRNFEAYGVRPYKEIDSSHEYPQIWLKQLESISADKANSN